MVRSLTRFIFLNDTCPQYSSPFFALPWELRSEIYRLMFDNRVFVSVVPRGPRAREVSDPGQYMLHRTCPNGTPNIPTESPIAKMQPVSPFTEMRWWQEGRDVPLELRCGCHLPGCVRILRTCQRIYSEARSIFFASLAFDFEAAPFQAFYKKYLCVQAHGFDPVSHVRHLALRRPFVKELYSVDGYPRPTRQNFNLWSDTLAILESPRWNLSNLFLEDHDLTIPRYGNFFSSKGLSTHPLRLMKQLRGVGQIHVTWRATNRYFPYNYLDEESLIEFRAMRTFETIYEKALNEITSQPKSDTSRKRKRRQPKDLTKEEIQQIETFFSARVLRLAQKEEDVVLNSEYGQSQMVWLRLSARLQNLLVPATQGTG